MLIIVHAMTKHGLLFVKDGERDCSRVPMDAPYDAEQLSAEWVFPANSQYEDYHATVGCVCAVV